MNIPIQAWASYVITLGACCGIIGYVVPGDPTARQCIFNLAIGLISGGLGVLTGHSIARNSVSGDNASATFPTSNQQ